MADLTGILRETGGLLNATRYILEHEGLEINANWWGDLETWRIYCLQCLRNNRPIGGKSCLAVEAEVNRCLNDAAFETAIRDLAKKLTQEECVDREELLAIPLDKLPQFSVSNNFPE